MSSTITKEYNLLSRHILIIIIAITGLLFAIIYLLIYLIHRQLHTITYLLSSNVILASSFYYIIVLSNHINAITYQSFSPRLCLIVSYLMLSAAASISYSLMLQALSRLFFIMFYRSKQLLSFKMHIYLLISIWLISFTLSPIPCLLSNGFIYETSLSLCAIDTTSISVVIYAVISGCLIPFSIIGFVYFYIMYHIQKQRNRSVVPTVQSTINNSRNLTDRNLLVLRKIMLNVTIMGVTGLPSFVIMILLVLRKTNVIISIYCTLFTVFGVVTMTITSFFLTKNIRKFFLNLICYRKIN